MERQPVESSNISSVGFDPETETLEVEFRNGSIYQYFGVPLPLFEQLTQSPSIGSFLNINIKESFPYERVG
jgi:hypothetical protein